MTTRTVITLNEAQLRFLQGSVGVALAVMAEADSGDDSYQTAFSIATFDAAFDGISLDHQDGQDLLTLLELAESVELSATDTTADDGEDFEPMGFEAAFVDAAAAAHCRL